MKHSIFLLVFFLFSSILVAQEGDGEELKSDPGELEKKIDEGNRLLAKGQFGLALPYWLDVVSEFPDDPDYNFKTGLCFRHTLDKKEKALPYFKKATSKMTYRYNFNGKGGEAPYDALYYLGETNLYRNEPDSALTNFTMYQDRFNGEPPIPVDRHILMCVRAKNPQLILVDTINQGSTINSAYAETNPVVTRNDSIMFFSSRRPKELDPGKEKEAVDPITGTFFEDIYVTTRENESTWTRPTRFKFSTDASEAPLALSADGATLYFRQEKKGVVNLYESHFEDGVWGKAKALGSNINSAYNETGVSVSGDGSYLYFISNREGGSGNYDIYQCAKKGNGKWGKAENIGPRVNTPYNEISVYVNFNGMVLYFSSNGYKGKGMGGYDIYKSKMQEDGSWSEPENLGSPINSTQDDLNYYFIDKDIRYFSRVNDNMSYDIYKITGEGGVLENIEAGTEVVTVTTELDVTSVLELEKEVEKEVEVVEFIEVPTEPETEEVETVDLSLLDEFDNSSGPDSLSDDSLYGEDEIPVMDVDSLLNADSLSESEIPEFDSLDVDAIDLARLDSLTRMALIEKVQRYLTEGAETMQVGMEATVYFDFNSRGINKASQERLKKVITYLKDHPKTKVEVIGHTDSDGTWGTNVRISKERAWEVFRYMRDRGISRNRILYYGKANIEPIASNEHEEGRKMNRRAEVVLLEE